MPRDSTPRSFFFPSLFRRSLLFLLRAKKEKRKKKEETCVTQKETIEIFPDNPARDAVRSGNKWRSVVRVPPTVFTTPQGRIRLSKISR